MLSSSSFENRLAHMADIRFRQAAFLGVDQIIRFDQNLVVDAVNRAKRVVAHHHT